MSENVCRRCAEATPKGRSFCDNCLRTDMVMLWCSNCKFTKFILNEDVSRMFMLFGFRPIPERGGILEFTGGCPQCSEDDSEAQTYTYMLHELVKPIDPEVKAESA